MRYVRISIINYIFILIISGLINITKTLLVEVKINYCKDKSLILQVFRISLANVKLSENISSDLDIKQIFNVAI